MRAIYSNRAPLLADPCCSTSREMLAGVILDHIEKHNGDAVSSSKQYRVRIRAEFAVGPGTAVSFRA